MSPFHVFLSWTLFCSLENDRHNLFFDVVAALVIPSQQIKTPLPIIQKCPPFYLLKRLSLSILSSDAKIVHDTYVTAISSSKTQPDIIRITQGGTTIIS